MVVRTELLDRVFNPSIGTFSKELSEQILDLHFPPSDHRRYEQLSELVQDGALSQQEQEELDEYINMNDFLMILKAKARNSLHQDNFAA